MNYSLTAFSVSNLTSTPPSLGTVSWITFLKCKYVTPTSLLKIHQKSPCINKRTSPNFLPCHTKPSIMWLPHHESPATRELPGFPAVCPIILQNSCLYMLFPLTGIELQLLPLCALTNSILYRVFSHISSSQSDWQATTASQKNTDTLLQLSVSASQPLLSTLSFFCFQRQTQRKLKTCSVEVSHVHILRLWCTVFKSSLGKLVLRQSFFSFYLFIF